MTEPTAADVEEVPADDALEHPLADLIMWMIPGRSVGISMPRQESYDSPVKRRP
ncbi:hypothetical protein ACWENQ_08235 [Nonomuraea sp. NPDC004354]